MATELMSSDGNWLKFTDRSPLPFEASRPLKVANPRNGPRPRMEISEAPPFSRWVEAPVMVSIASPIDDAGRSPISSADRTSATMSALRFWLIDDCTEARKPVTTTSSTWEVGGAGVAVWAWARPAPTVQAMPHRSAAFSGRRSDKRDKLRALYGRITSSPGHARFDGLAGSYDDANHAVNQFS